jgi:hypothetical protein
VQQSLASSNADTQRFGLDDKTLRRLNDAETSMESILQRVDVEATAVQQAVSDLQAANTELEQDFMWKLKRGGLPKQAMLAGFMLLSVRSIIESITAVSSSVDSEEHLYAALLQGVIAMVCAVIFFIL